MKVRKKHESKKETWKEHFCEHDARHDVSSPAEWLLWNAAYYEI